jgi:hypothetical protein
MYGDHHMYLRSKLLLSPTYTLVSQLPSSLQIFTPQFPQLSHAFYMSCQRHPHSSDHTYPSSFLHRNIAFGTFYRYCNTYRYQIQTMIFSKITIVSTSISFWFLHKITNATLLYKILQLSISTTLYCVLP